MQTHAQTDTHADTCAHAIVHTAARPTGPSLLLSAQLKEKREKAEVAKGQRRDAFKQGKLLGISGRELFEFNPDAIQDDDEAAEGTRDLTSTEVDSSDSESVSPAILHA